MLTIVISTVGEGIERLDKAIAYRHPAVRYLVVQQVGRLPRATPDYLLRRADVAVFQSATRGLAVSRNIGLERCQTPYALLADDDVEYLPAGLEQLLDAVRTQRPDFALFQIQTPHGEPPYKDYPPAPYTLTRLRHWVSSIEILVNANKLKADGIRFDERFGLGASLDRGEEEIFVSDLIRKGWLGRYFPIPIVKHPYESSGKKVRSRKEQFFFQGAFDARTEARTVPPATLLDCLRNPGRLVDAFHYRRGRKYVKQTS